MTTAATATLIRLWDTDWRHVHTFEPGVLTESEPNVFTLPCAHPAAQWIGEHWPSGMFITVDQDGTRFSARLDSVTIKRAGTCPVCPHCAEKVMETHWRPDLDMVRKMLDWPSGMH